MSRSLWQTLLELLGLRAAPPGPVPRAAGERPARSPGVVRATTGSPRPSLEPIAEVAPDDLAEVDLAQVAADTGPPQATLTPEQREAVAALVAATRAAFDVTRIKAHAFPTRASQIVGLLTDEDFDVDQLVALTQRDPALSASVLRVANSAALGGLEPIEGVREAVVRLGARTVAGIAVVLASRRVFEGGPSSQGALREAWSGLWLQSVSSAFAAGELALERRAGNLEHCFLGGMLHDIGKTFALHALGGPAMSPAAGVAGAALTPALITAVLEEVHVEFGVAAATSWNLPAYVVEVCEAHHAPLEGANVDVRIVRLASGLAALQLSPHHREGLEDDVRATARSLGMDRFALRATVTAVRESVTKARSL